MRLMIIGDTHGNVDWLSEYIYPTAVHTGTEAVLVLGDFGYWEHTTEGVDFLDEVSELACGSGIALYWLHGNHDKHSLALQQYGRNLNRQGFIACRDFVYYIPQGHTWTWGGDDVRSFGGAYSVDKQWRLEEEQRRYQRLLRQCTATFAETGVPSLPVPSQEATLWFPEEQMTDAQMTALLAADSRPKQVVLSHDKPYSAQPGPYFKDLPECMPNQLRLERALRAHRPAWWFHGHLHQHYVDQVLGDGWASTVVGLAPEPKAAQGRRATDDSWAVAELTDGKIEVKLGRQVYLSRTS